jgi:hypothetical protein
MILFHGYLSPHVSLKYALVPTSGLASVHDKLYAICVTANRMDMTEKGVKNILAQASAHFDMFR